MRRRTHSQSGLSLAEVLVGLGIISVMIYASMAVTQSAHRMTTINNDKEFGTQKAISMLEEMRSLVQSNTTTDITVLDNYDDGITPSTVLTIQGTKLPTGSTQHATLPDDPISGNVPYGTKWTYDRLITVQRLTGQANDVRLVNVKVFKNAEAGRVLLAEVSGVLRALVITMPPSQVYDVYAVAVENVPGWWVYMTNLVPFVENAISDLQARNPGLVFRTHWIHTLAYGRDQEYMPYVNQVPDSTADINYAYFYPGTMPSGSAAPEYYPTNRFHGHVNIDGTQKNGYDATLNPYPYAEADQYNHAMRYPDELNLYNARKSANSSEEMTLRLLLDDIYARPYNYTNALIINLHGELLPLPPVRNYSDAAKDPEQTFNPDLSYVRVVTHPEQLRYQNTDNVTLRVYSYLSDPEQPNKDILPVPITLTVIGVKNWIPATNDIQVVEGGVNTGSGSPDPYAVNNVKACPNGNKMCYTAGLAPNGVDTVIRLYNSPLRSPWDPNNHQGLPWGSRLYGLEYIPSPVEDLTTGAVPFTANLATKSPLPRNTARWIITIPAVNLNNNIIGAVETRIGDQLTSGTEWPVRNHPANLSRTFFYRGTDTFINGDTTANPPVPAALPPTERFQFQGDPRHCPYSDLKRPHQAGAFPAGPNPPKGSYESPLGMGYNRYFDNFEENANYNAATDAAMISQKGGTGAGPSYTFPAGQNVIAVKMDGSSTTTASVSFTAGNTYTLAQIITKLNGNTTFAKYAIADSIGTHLRIISKGATAGKPPSVQFDTNATNDAAAVFGFDDTTWGAGAWVGWSYLVGGTQYGIHNGAGPGNAGWDGHCGQLDIDVNRYFQLVRSGLIRSNALWTTMTGFSYYYVGLGGEIGYDQANGFPQSIPVSAVPYGGASGSSMNVDTITNDAHNTPYMSSTELVRTGDSTWWTMPWIGELYPDWRYAVGGNQVDWRTWGNLPAGNTASAFRRDTRDNFPVYSGTSLTQTVHRTCRAGSPDLFWAGSAASTFHHDGGPAKLFADIQTAGTDIANNYSFPVPSTIDSNRPFGIAQNDTGSNPSDFLQQPYGGVNTLGILNTYYLHQGGLQSSSLLTNRDANWNVAFVAVNGLSPTGTSGTTFIAKWSFLTLVQSYLNGGLYTDASAKPTAHHIRQLPRLAISAPNVNTNLSNPTSINVAWDIAWTRWDNKPYTAAYPANYSESLTMKYAVLYSTTNGFPDPANGITTGWFYMQDDTTAYPGVKPDTQHEVTATSYTWSTPAAKFPQGNYLIRVEGYREGWPLHYAFHQFRAFVKR